MKRGLILTEGSDDLSALREILLRRFGSGVPRASTRFKSPDWAQQMTWPDAETHVLVVKGAKTQLGRKAIEQIEKMPFEAEPFEQIGVCFDPNGMSDRQVSDWLLKGFVPPGDTPTATKEGLIVSHSGVNIPLISLPWDLGAGFDELDARLRNLERVALEILGHTDPAEAQLVDQFLAVLREKKKSISWKTAFRLWAAFRYADRDPGSGAMDQVFGQDKGVHAALDAVFKDSEFLRRLAFFAGTSASTPPAKA